MSTIDNITVTNNAIPVLLIVIIIGTVLLYCSGNGTAGKTLSREEASAELDRIFADYDKMDSPGAAVMVIRDGEIFLTGTWGMANIEENLPVTSTTNFRLASVTKQFTAMCIMMLVDEGKLSYEKTLSEIFSGFPDYGKSITIRHLLHHTSGLIAYESVIPEGTTEQLKDADVLALMMKQDSTYFTPGDKYRYSNSGYALLAMIVEQKTGMTFAEFLNKQIFAPLKMDSSVAFENGISEVAERAYGYVLTDGSTVMKDQSLTSAVLGDGGIYTSLADYAKWDQALYGEQLVSAETIDEAFTPGIFHTPENGNRFGYGFGWRTREIGGRTVLFHSGSTSGFLNFCVRIPYERLTVLFLSNFDHPDYKRKVNESLRVLTAGMISDIY